ncbi:hypothetical protein LG293_17660 (plasmid) [Citricoccus nitrophenolicus]
MPQQKLPTTGTSPLHHNNHQRTARYLDRTVRGAFRIIGDNGRIPRKRKKQMYLVERANYRDLLLSVAESLAARAPKGA